MTVKLVSTNDHPRPSILDERHEAEWLQRFLDDEQGETTRWSAFVIRIFVAGIATGALGITACTLIIIKLL